jgi:hypothetical protein
MAARYGFNSVTGTIPSGSSKVQALVGNASRVSLIVSAVSNAAVRISSLGGSGVDGNWCIVLAASGIVLKFADLGPVIQQPVFISHLLGSPLEITVTEVYKLPWCK